jgi:hypothetical protein
VNQPKTYASASGNEGRKAAWLVARGLAGFAVLWLIFYGTYRTFPYLTSGAEVLYRSKLRQEMSGNMFPAHTHARRVLIFGDSKVMAGFIPFVFDSLATADGLSVSSYNSGYPARSEFVPQLKKMAENKSILPDILLLTKPWRSTQKQKGFDPFNPLPSDHEIADRIFPFRDLVRDTFTFLVASREHGGVRNYYRESRIDEARMLNDRGYYFITERNHYPNYILPDDFHLSTDRPEMAALRVADPASDELTELNAIIQENHIQCFYVPVYLRVGESAAAPDVDQAFADLLQRYTSCKLLGPDYYLYPNRMFSDPVHVNREGARIYTESVYRLLAKQILER